MKKQIQTALEESPPDRFQRLQTMKSRLISVLLSGEKQKLRKIFSNIVCANNPTAKRPQLVKLSETNQPINEHGFLAAFLQALVLDSRPETVCRRIGLGKKVAFEEIDSIVALISCPILVTECLISSRVQGLAKNPVVSGQYLDLSAQS